MKIICVGDAYVTLDMLKNGVEPYIKHDDEIKYFFFGEENRVDMRDTVKAIEAMKCDEIAIPNELYQEITDADLLIVHLCPVTKALLKCAKKLKAIMSCRGGNENIDVQFATEMGIIVSTNPAHNANAVAEYTVGLILCETRNISRADRSLKNGIWREKYPNTVSTILEIKDLTIGIIGFGSVGRLVAEKLSVFGCEILICDPYISESAYDFINFRFVDMDTLLSKSDVITLHARSKTSIIGKEEFLKMKGFEPAEEIKNSEQETTNEPPVVNSSTEEENKQKNDEDKQEDENQDESAEETPDFDKMTVPQLKKYAKEHDIDLMGANKKDEIIPLIIGSEN